MSKRIKRIGDWIAQVEVLAYARGGAVNYSEVRQFDIDASDAAVTAFDPDSTAGAIGVETNPFGNTVPVDTAGIANLFPIGVCNEVNGIADDGFGWWVLEGICEVAFKDDDADGASTDDIDIGDAIICLNGQDYVAALAAATRLVGIALESAAADSNNTDRTVDASSHSRWAIWFGGRPGGGMYAPA